MTQQAADDDQSFTGTCPTCGRKYLDAEIKRLRTFLETVQVMVVGKQLYIGVMAGDGCWSAEVPEEGREIFLQWKADRDAALANGELASPTTKENDNG